jgi:glyoxylase-like metal-dependent hydrolase (beta-lactamase superfamily II)
VNNGTYHFKLGNFECVSLSDGSYDYPLENLFANAPVTEIEAALRRRGLPTDFVTTPYTYLTVDTGEHRVLVDMGAGHLGPRTGRLVESIKAAGLSPAEIDTVVITHAHPDHIGGTLDEAGKPVYANARYYISKDEWEFWFSEAALTKTPEIFVEIAREQLQPVQQRVTLLEGDCEIVSGVRALAAHGHTPGHIVVQFCSGDEKLYYIGDVVLYPLHLDHPDWVPIYDILPDKAAESKHTIFDRLAEEKAWVVGQHFPPFPSLGHVEKKDDGWEWRPIDVQVGRQ